MECSPYFLQAMYLKQSPSLADYYERRSSSLFVTESSQSWIDCYEPTAGACLVNIEPEEPATPKGYDSEMIEGTEWPQLVGEQFPNLAQRQMADQHMPENGFVNRVRHIEELQDFVNGTANRNRIFLIRQRNSYSRLYITRQFFECLEAECRVFAQFREYMLCFGTKSGETEVAPPHLRFRNSAAASMPLGNTDFECAYALRFVELNNRGRDERPWSLRQFAVYLKFDSASKSSTWLFVALSRRAELRLDDYLRNLSSPSSLNPFELHIILLDTALSNWRPYLFYLAAETGTLAARVVAASIEDDSLVRLTEFTEYQRLKQIDDDLLDLLVILDSTLDIIESLCDEYSSIRIQQALGRSIDGDAPKDPIITSLLEQKRDVLLQQSKVKALRAKVISTTKLVSSMLDLGNGHSLKTLAEESKVENTNMQALTLKGFQDAVAIKVLTIVTLVYLPATVVSNFFSTQFVSQAGNNDGTGTHLVVASNWWIFVVATIPLTVITIYIWWFYVQKQAYGSYPGWFEFIKKSEQEVSRRIFRRKPSPEVRREGQFGMEQVLD